MIEDYTKMLFDEGDKVCVSKNPYETKSVSLDEANTDHCYVTLNPLKEGTKRSDKSVSKFRNFLLEFDELPTGKQKAYVDSIDLPYSTCVFSGNKSYHFVVSLEEPLADRAEYDHIVRWLYAAVAGVDESCKNPSRFTRLGGGTHQNEARQTLVSTTKRVSIHDLVVWLMGQCDEPYSVCNDVKQMADEEYFKIQKSGYRAKIHKATLGFIKTGGRKGFRHKNVYIAACNLRDCYYTLTEAKVLLLDKLGKIYAEQGREFELELKERAVEDAYLQQPKVQTRSK